MAEPPSPRSSRAKLEVGTKGSGWFSPPSLAPGCQAWAAGDSQAGCLCAGSRPLHSSLPVSSHWNFFIQSRSGPGKTGSHSPNSQETDLPQEVSLIIYSHKALSLVRKPTQETKLSFQGCLERAQSRGCRRCQERWGLSPLGRKMYGLLQQPVSGSNLNPGIKGRWDLGDVP